ncbi:MAG: alpha/beta fold hydrolase [Actinomycetota bacterium]
MSIANRRVDVGDVTMATLDVGSGPPIVLLHGNPTSSYLWRNIVPFVRDLGRVIAPDLVGHGRSDKLTGQGRYRFVEQSRYLEALLDGLGVSEQVTLVLHDWGAALGFDWARRHPEAATGICYLERRSAGRERGPTYPSCTSTRSRCLVQRLRRPLPSLAEPGRSDGPRDPFRPRGRA